MGFDPITLATVAILKGGASLMAQRQAGKAAHKEARYKQDLIDSKAVATRQAMKENSKRVREDKAHSLAKLRVAQAAAGFGDSGTPLAVFGEIESRIDERIDAITDQSLNQLTTLSSQRDMIGFADEQAQAGNKLGMFGTVIGAGTNAAMGYRTGYRETGKDPFSLLS